MLTSLFDEIQVFLPKYLSPTHQKELAEELDRFPDNLEKNFYLTEGFEDQALQGDGWRGLVVINFVTLKKKPVNGLIVSNSCDIDPSNKSDLKRRVLFAPIIKLERFVELLRAGNRPENVIENKLASLRRQEITSLFYLPEFPGAFPEAFVALDDIHQHPLDDFLASDRAKLFTLGQLAFYLLLMKLSVHLTRLQEGIARYPVAE